MLYGMCEFTWINLVYSIRCLVHQDHVKRLVALCRKMGYKCV